MILNRIAEFYDDIFQYHYEKQKKMDSDPEVFPIILISFCQGANFMILLVAIYFMTDLNIVVGKKFLPYSILVLIFLFTALNFYQYMLKNRTKAVLNRNKKINKRIGVYSGIYLLVSLWFPLFLIYYFNEFY
tara:strand:- start:112 stop:507 length:396 start_codon:yes stop_codon:yes gene_type:complete